jgi:hypothetical protein
MAGRALPMQGGLIMAHIPFTPLEERIWYHYPYVLPAALLSDEPTHVGDPSSLRADASQGDSCYVHIIRSFGDGTFLVRVAAAPNFKHTQGFTLVLTEAHLSQATPWDGSIQAA